MVYITIEKRFNEIVYQLFGIRKLRFFMGNFPRNINYFVPSVSNRPVLKLQIQLTHSCSFEGDSFSV